LECAPYCTENTKSAYLKSLSKYLANSSKQRTMGLKQMSHLSLQFLIEKSGKKS